LDTELYRERNEEQSESVILNEKISIVEEAEISKEIHSHYLSYKMPNYFDMKNKLRNEKYKELNRVCPVLSLPGQLDVFYDDENFRIIIKLHLKNKDKNHLFKLFRSHSKISLNEWKMVSVQIQPDRLMLYLDGIIDLDISLKEFNIYFENEAPENSNKNLFLRHDNSSSHAHSGILIGTIDNYKFKETSSDTELKEKKTKSLLNPEIVSLISKTSEVNP
jgi:hypothetical protein